MHFQYNCKVTNMKPKLIALALLSLVFSISLFAQKKKKGATANQVTCVYGDVKPEDFATSVYSIDSSAEAVYLFNGGNSLVTTSKGFGWEVIRSSHVKIRLLKKPAFDLATIRFHMYVTSNIQQQLENLKATTYNISNGAVVATNLDKKDIFQEKSDDKHVAVKFTFPNVTEGSIIEYSYSITTPSAQNLNGWEFQKRYPVLLTDYQINYPSVFNYVVSKKGYQPYVTDTITLKNNTYLYRQETGDGLTRNAESLTISCQAVNGEWAMKDLPALKREPFITTLDNYISQIDFQLSTIQYSKNDVIHFLQSWTGVADTLIKEDFYLGKAFAPYNNFLDDDVNHATSGQTNELAKARKIYEWVRDNYTATDTRPWLEQNLRKIYQSKKGNSAEINSVLLVMLKKAGLIAYPLLLSTTDNGKITSDYPLLDQYNAVICVVKTGGKNYFLDASNSKLGFNKLSTNCYNGYARIINPANPELVNLSADSLKENEITSVFIANAETGLTGEISNTKGYEESLSLREELAKTGKENFFKNIRNGYSENVSVKEEIIDSLTLLDMPLRIGYHITFESNDEDVLYFNPMLANRQRDNPFTAAERYYPVEMPFCKDEIYILNMDVPKGYEVDEMPKSTRVKLNENEGMFEYIIAKSDDHIQMRAHVKLEKAMYEPDDYQTLRDFFTYIVKKEEEQIVFKKIK